MMYVMHGKSSSRQDFTRFVGIGSRWQDLGVDSVINFFTRSCVSVTGSNSDNSQLHEETSPERSEGGNDATILLTLS